MSSHEETMAAIRELLALSEKQLERQKNHYSLISAEFKEINEKANIPAQSDLAKRLTAREERMTNFEIRLSNIEKLLKAS